MTLEERCWANMSPICVALLDRGHCLGLDPTVVSPAAISKKPPEAGFRGAKTPLRQALLAALARHADPGDGEPGGALRRLYGHPQQRRDARPPGARRISPRSKSTRRRRRAGYRKCANSRPGHIFNISSVAEVVGLKHCSAYGASKFAGEGLSLSMAEEVAQLGTKMTGLTNKSHQRVASGMTWNFEWQTGSRAVSALLCGCSLLASHAE